MSLPSAYVSSSISPTSYLPINSFSSTIEGAGPEVQTLRNPFRNYTEMRPSPTRRIKFLIPANDTATDSLRMEKELSNIAYKRHDTAKVVGITLMAVGVAANVAMGMNGLSVLFPIGATVFFFADHMHRRQLSIVKRNERAI